MPQVSPKLRSGHSEGTLEMQEFRLTVKEGGWWTLHYDSDSNDGNTFESLSELVQGNCSLETLYPDIQKADAFSIPQTAAKISSGDKISDELPGDHGN